MRDLDTTVKQNDEAVVRAWERAIEDGNIDKAARIALANPDLFVQL